jgi:hypothetical protein
VQVGGDDDCAEAPTGQGPWAAILQIGLHDLEARHGRDGRGVAVDCRYLVAAPGEEARMTSSTRRYVEHASFGCHQAGPLDDPR